MLASQTPPQPKIALQGMRKEFSFRGRLLPVLDGVDFYAAEGEFVSIIGPSGCGKSTLLNIIAGLEEPNEGSLRLNGEESRRPLGQVGYMHQKDLLMPWRSVLDNAVLGLEVQGTPRAAARRQALALMERFGLRGFENEYPHTLSGGMRQRAAFLRTILTRRDIVLLDEPFGALDALTRAQMQEWLLDLWATLGKTIVLVTHDVEEALFLADRVYVLTRRPARVKMVLPVEIPRPRRYQVVTQEPFISLKARLLAAIRQESEAAQEGPWR
ncbi:MAG: ABC transporter ATP-binding protein [Chloroflexi bacterium]|nr:ABC transporter ATP-binding protein [Chloroflexota bacterium]